MKNLTIARALLPLLLTAPLAAGQTAAPTDNLRAVDRVITARRQYTLDDGSRAGNDAMLAQIPGPGTRTGISSTSGLSAARISRHVGAGRRRPSRRRGTYRLLPRSGCRWRRQYRQGRARRGGVRGSSRRSPARRCGWPLNFGFPPGALSRQFVARPRRSRTGVASSPAFSHADSFHEASPSRAVSRHGRPVTAVGRSSLNCAICSGARNPRASQTHQIRRSVSTGYHSDNPGPGESKLVIY
jgi:hypothetical protein